MTSPDTGDPGPGLQASEGPRRTGPEDALLSVEALKVVFETHEGALTAVDDATFSVARGETLGIVGESGSGKTVTALSLLGLVPAPGKVVDGEIRWQGEVLTEGELRRHRGCDIGMVFQDPMNALSPLVPVGRQITEGLRRHRGMNRRRARERALELLNLVGIPAAEERFDQLPFQFSGGMRQRVLIAAALAPEPQLIVADEPTTALDVTVQAQILDLFTTLQERLGLAIIFISHDLGVVRNLADRVMVMYAGRTVEVGPTQDVLHQPLHPYTWGLLASSPAPSRKGQGLTPIGGRPPSIGAWPPGCRFHVRCPYRFEPCDNDLPELVDRSGGHPDACHLPVEEKRRLRSAALDLQTEPLQ